MERHVVYQGSRIKVDYRTLYGVAFSFLILTGCATGPQQRAYDKTANSSLKSIEVLPMRHSEIDLFIFNNPGYSFGLIGLAIAEANRAPKANWLESEVSKSGFDHVKTFDSALDVAIREAGYELVWSDQPMEASNAKTKRDDWGLRRTYAASASDAVLDISFGFIGYAAAGSGDNAPYRPTVVLFARLMDAGGTRVLFQDQIIYNSVFPGNSTAITINPDERYRYPDFDDLKAAGPQAVDGLTAAFNAVAVELTKQLQR